MRNIDDIKEALRLGHFDFSDHAFDRVIEKNISVLEISECWSSIEVIEYYDKDKYTPSSLILGFTKGLRSLHLLVSRTTEPMRIITIYEPDPKRWEDNRRRK